MIRAKQFILPGAILGAALLGVVGTSLLNSLTIEAATDQSTTSAVTSAANGDVELSAATPQPNTNQVDPTKGGHIGANGTKEASLTGDTAEKVKAAALAAVTGGTIERVETDAEGSPYEAHMTKSDGSRVTVKVDSSFKVTSIEDGPGR